MEWKQELIPECRAYKFCNSMKCSQAFREKNYFEKMLKRNCQALYYLASAGVKKAKKKL